MDTIHKPICQECGKQATIIAGENILCEKCWDLRLEKAKWERDKHILEYAPNEFPNKASAMVIGGISAENYDKIKPKPKEEFTLVWDKDLESYEEEDRDWLIDKLIPTCSVGVWTGKRATYKTFTALEAVYAISSGTLFAGRYPTKQGTVLYLDKENGIPIIKKRARMIKKGRQEDTPYDLGFICFSTLKIDKSSDLKKIEELIVKHKPIALFIDTYRRAIGFDENDAGEVSKLFVDTLRPLVEKYKLSIVLIHHDKKSGQGEGHDEMDMLRGSSDLANYADFILKNKIKGGGLVLEQIKNRNAPEVKPISLTFQTDNETYFKFGCGGDYVPQSRDEKCAEAILLWITKNELKEFKTKEVQDMVFGLGVKRSSFFYAMKMLEDRGIIRKKQYGVYEVSGEDSKFV